ncbi:meiotically up-regulated gene 113-domain-containing protein [Protomyces lactucae-debilis]|uniref:Meiotically up-regulated gene 113-domain-containing protein n=1 Tax=Protomyces lactucae-debilis TaxID=2754530 RepID=A0A1Y2FV74_PROLT|nr:meiotically up-regulated gene 113-domain-containing protein [Protomyces lactucae-debilis]ORY87898.1 meiotically up-regulated gene 113-domain-containing protein [Protomyces lactucae-debilis]
MSGKAGPAPDALYCRGRNAKGDACRNVVSATRIDRFCHHHREQQDAPRPAQVAHGDEILLAREESPEPFLAPPLERLRSTPKFTKDALAAMHEQINGRVSTPPVAEKPMRAFPATLRTPAEQEIGEAGTNASFWGACFGCFAASPPSVETLPSVPEKPPSDDTKRAAKVARKPVVYDVQGTEMQPVAPAGPAALPARILQNHLDLQQHLQHLTLAPSAAQYIPDATDPSVAQLTPAQYKKLASYAQSLADRSEAGTLAAPSAVFEYIYVFRLDGDHHWTPQISLKIGRTSSVERRLKQWTRQCKQQVDFLDSFPTQYSSSLERLIHLELQVENVRTACDGCGTVHREWFALERDTARGRVRRSVERWQQFLQGIHRGQIAV